MLALALAVLPSIRKILGKSEQTEAINATIKKRLSAIVYVSIIGLLITGVLMSRQAVSLGLTTGFLSFGTEYGTLLSIKHILYFVMIFLSIFRSQIIDRVRNFPPPTKMKLNMITLLLNMLSGLAVLFLSAYLSVLASILTP
jgi:putative copper export protein